MTRNATIPIIIQDGAAPPLVHARYAAMPSTRTVVHFFRPTAWVFLALFAVLAFRLVAGGWGHPQSIQARDDVADSLSALGADRIQLPAPELTPDEVVRTQLAGLADPAPHGVGILQCWAFASPGNRRVTGPLDRFGRMVRDGAFACLARPQATLIGRPCIEGDVARVLVTVIDDQQQMQGFQFILSRQKDDPFAGCWMTEAVFPVTSLAPPESPPKSSQVRNAGSVRSARNPQASARRSLPYDSLAGRRGSGR